MADDRQNRIRQRAHEIWEHEGRPQGAHERHWQQAENEVTAEDAKTTKKPAAAREPAAAKSSKPAAAKAGKPAAAKATAAPKPVKAAVKSKPSAAKKS